MLTDRGLTLLAQMDETKIELAQVIETKVDWKLSLECLQSSNLFEQSISFQVFTGAYRDEIVPKFQGEIDVPILLLGFLLNCIEENITPEQEELYEYVYDRGGAFLDLRVPLDPYWAKHGCELTEERYFDCIAEFLKKNSREYYDELPTHVLEAWPLRQKPFSTIMRGWKDDPVLERYVADLESIFQLTI